MIMLFGLNFSLVCMLWGCCHVRGHGVCQNNLITRINLTTELQSEILLPCYSEPALFGSNMTANVSVEWTHISTPVDFIVEIKVSGEVLFWNHRGKRIKAFPDFAGSGNFSILIRDVQRSDLGLYRCELFREFNCSLGYKDTQLSLTAIEFSLLNNWQLMLAASGGVLLLCVFIGCGYYTWTKRKTVYASVDHNSPDCHDNEGQAGDEITYGSVAYKPHNCIDSNGQRVDEVTYASVAHKPRNCTESNGNFAQGRFYFIISLRNMSSALHNIF
ncbi:uncharacterized protein si:dkey-65b12.12 isoform X1 [Myxocyprinus asiaticus]|uniref:uncharacterized protein si:dkey-65b12.12 isoform X1 n=1 Tax=Myxocyprinus asiaticus TaxID=70543 RepID=UPI002221F736|nr:uncharacterized protein si:dkey-65b12.12 isoform X1 [Myxocyprinus asiaticus]